MGIKVTHSPSAGVVGVTAYAVGRGKAKTRQHKDFLRLYTEGKRHQERLQEQYRGFVFRGALEGMRQQGWADRDDRQREFAQEDEERQRGLALEDEQRQRKWEAGKADVQHRWDMQAEERRSQAALGREKVRGEYEIDQEIWEGIRSGELELPQTSRGEMAALDERAAKFAVDPSYSDEQKEEGRKKIAARRRELLRTAQPSQTPMIKEQIEQGIHWDGGSPGKGRPLVLGSDGQPEVMRGWKPDEEDKHPVTGKTPYEHGQAQDKAQQGYNKRVEALTKDGAMTPEEAQKKVDQEYAGAIAAGLVPSRQSQVPQTPLRQPSPQGQQQAGFQPGQDQGSVFASEAPHRPTSPQGGRAFAGLGEGGASPQGASRTASGAEQVAFEERVRSSTEQRAGSPSVTHEQFAQQAQSHWNVPAQQRTLEWAREFALFLQANPQLDKDPDINRLRREAMGVLKNGR